MNSTYESRPAYEELGPDEIRILTVTGTEAIPRPGRPGVQDLAISCRLTTRRLSRAGERGPAAGYAALSYVWGSAVGSRPVVCGGVVVGVTANLHDALWHVVADADTLPVDLWVDALCIDQRNPVEKGHQVARMGAIYRRAAYVVAWLGSAPDRSSPALDEFWAWLEDMHHTEIDQLTPPSEAAFVAGNDFFNQCNWFKRAWTFQEFVLARQIFLKIAHRTLDWNVICLLPTRHWHTGLNTTMSRIHNSVSRAKKQSSSFCALLIANQERISTDPRDRFFALLGIYTGRETLEPDYESSIEKINAKVAVLVSREQKNLNFLDVLTSLHADQNLLTHTPLPASILRLKKSRQFASVTRIRGDATPLPCIPDFTRVDKAVLSDMLRVEHVTQYLCFVHYTFRLTVSLKENRLMLRGAILAHWLPTDVHNGTFKPTSTPTIGRGSFHHLPECVRLTSRTIDMTRMDPSTHRFTCGRFLPKGIYNPLYRDASEIFDRILDHKEATCNCQFSKGSNFRRHKKVHSRSISSSSVSTQENGEVQPDRNESMIWCCVLFGSLQPYIIRASYVDDGKQFRCWLIGKLPYDDARSQHVRELAEFTLRHHEEFSSAANPSLSRPSEVLPVQLSGLNFARWTSPEDISSSLGFDMSWVPACIELSSS